MPLNTELGPLGAKTKKRLDEPRRSTSEVLGVTDSTKALGRDARSGVEAKIGAKALTLDFDPTQEIASRTAQIEQRFQKARKSLGRQFAISPGGTTTEGLQSGQEQRRFEELESGRISELNRLDAEISQRTGTERRANLAALQGVQRGSEQAELAAEQINLQGVGQSINARQTERGLGLREAEIFGGDVGGTKRTVTSKQLEEQIRQFDIETGTRVQEFAQRHGLSVLEFDEAKRQFDSGVALDDKQLEETIRQFNKDLEQRQGEFSQSSAFEKDRIAIAERAVTLDEQKETNAQALRRAQLTGSFNLTDGNGNPILDDQGNPVTVETLAAREMVLAEAEATGVFGDKQTMRARELALKEEIERGRLELQTQAERFGQNVSEAEITGVYRQMGMNEMGEFWKAFGSSGQGVGSAEGRIGAGGAKYSERYDLNNDREINYHDYDLFKEIAQGTGGVDTLAGQTLAETKANRYFDEAVRRGQATGTFEGKTTAAEKDRIFRENFAKAELTGMFEGATTTEEKRRIFEENVTKSGITGYFESEATADERKTLFDNSLKSAQLFGGSPPVSFTDDEWTKSLGKTSKDPDYRPEFDLNQDGKIEMDELLEVSNRVEKVGGVNVYTPPGKQTIASRELNLDEKRVNIAAAQFEDRFSEMKREFDSQFSGNLYNEKGVPIMEFKTRPPFQDPETGLWTHFKGEWGPVGGLARDQLTTQQTQWQQNFDTMVTQFADQMGFAKEQMEATSDANEMFAWSNLVSGLFQALGNLPSPGGGGPGISVNIGGGGGPGGFDLSGDQNRP
jgi:hypothetical protein